jgi:hypothetical protein
MELDLSHPSGTYNFQMAPRVLNTKCTPLIFFSSFPLKFKMHFTFTVDHVILLDSIILLETFSEQPQFIPHKFRLTQY